MCPITYKRHSFTIDPRTQDNSCFPSTCEADGNCNCIKPNSTQPGGYFLDLSNRHLCCKCAAVGKCPEFLTHCTNKFLSFCGVCVDTYDIGANTTFSKCESTINPDFY